MKKKTINLYTVSRTDDAPVTVFAAAELAKYIYRLDPYGVVSMLCGSGQTGFQVGVGLGDLPETVDPMLDDAIYIEVDGGSGIISGNNPRSTLIAVYRFLREAGYIFAAPGAENEFIPNDPAVLHRKIRVRERAAYRHRGICMEGINSYRNIADLIDWMPKQALNAYFSQHFSGYWFMREWYRDHGAPITEETGLQMTKEYEAEIRKRGLMYHAAGHGWTSQPFGISAVSWDEKKDRSLPDDYKKVLSLLGGKRRMFSWDENEGTPSNTNLCYSQKAVRDRITDAVCRYAQEHPEVDYLHFWLADGMENHCECPECSVQRPSDWYVMMLNELDAKMTAGKIRTKIVFLVYVDLMWAPEKEMIRNPERFVLMFAPITRRFSESFAQRTGNETTPPYVRNHLQFPISTGDNLAHLAAWRKMFRGDSFNYDYHGVSPFFCDPGQHLISRIMYEDVRELQSVGLNGNMSCQYQSIFLPSGLLMLVMTRMLWDPASGGSFAEIESAYYDRIYGEDGGKLRTYMAFLTAHYELGFIRNEQKEPVSEFRKQQLRDVLTAVQEFRSVIRTNLRKWQCQTVRYACWRRLGYHAAIVTYLAEIILAALDQKKKTAERQVARLQKYLCRIEPDVQNILDTGRLILHAKSLVNREIPRILANHKNEQEK